MDEVVRVFEARKFMKSIGLALGGGGARGFAHIGILKVLEHAGVPVGEIAGTSMGAIVGAYYAVHQEVDSLEDFVTSLDRKRTLSYLDPALPKYGLIKGEKLRKLLFSWFGERKIEDASVPFAICATNLRTGKGTVWRRGKIVERLMASAALPGILPAMKVGSEYYVDGGIVLQVPTAAVKSETKVAVELPLLSPPEKFMQQPKLFELLSFVYGIQRSIGTDIEEASLVIRPKSKGFQETLSFTKSAEFIRSGERAARHALSSIKKL